MRVGQEQLVPFIYNLSISLDFVQKERRERQSDTLVCLAMLYQTYHKHNNKGLEKREGRSLQLFGKRFNLVQSPGEGLCQL